MEVIRSIRELQARADADRAAGRRLALVPTMGALHAGHLSLVETARREADRVWVSIFVNPTQFDDPGDLEAYPQTWEEDLSACRAAGVDGIFAPTAKEMYPEGAQTTIEVTGLSKPLCGAARPGHFRGVTTVVAKLLLAAKPHVAVFGEKDWQQLVVIRQMARDLNLDVEILGAPIARESDGLAMSSRNLRLDPDARRQATVIPGALEAAQQAFARGERRADVLLQRVREEIGRSPLAEIDYAELRDPDSLEPAPDRLEAPTLLALAVFLGSVRLIDNCMLLASSPASPGVPPGG